MEKWVKQVRVHNMVTFPEARKLVEMATPAVADKSCAVAAAPNRATKGVAINTEPTWHFNEAKYKKHSGVEKAPKQKEKTGSENKESIK